MPATTDPATCDPGPIRPGERRRFTIGLAAITIVGLIWRVAYTLATKRHDTDLFDEGDAFYYANVARNMADGHFYVNPFNGAPAADHPPLTVLVATPAAWLFGDSILAQRLTMTLIGAAVIAAMGLLGRQVAGWKAGLAAAAIAAATPNLWINDAVIMSESISALLIVGCVSTGFALARRPTVRNAAIAGATCGLTVLARAEMGLLFPFMIVPILALAGDLGWRERIGRMALAGALLGAVIAPWTIWNLTQFEKPVFLSTNDGTTLLGANCPAVYDTGIVGGWSLKCVLDTDVDGLDASEASARQRRIGLSYARHHVGALPKVLMAREGRTFGVWRPDQSVYANQGEGRPRWASWAGIVSFWLLIPFSVIGARRLRCRGVTLVPVAACLVTVVVVSGLFYGIPRFRLPLDVVMCLLAGVAVTGWLGRSAGVAVDEPELSEPAEGATPAA